MQEKRLKKIEIDLLIEAIRSRYGFDFTHYSRASFNRRLERFLGKRGMKHIADLIPPLLHDRAFFQDFLFTLSITVTEMFRDPSAFLAVRSRVLPVLMSYPSLKIWHAGCSTGEEVYAMAIMLKEEGLYERCQIYATDFNDQALQIAKEGIYPLEQLTEYENNYSRAGGTGKLSGHYHARYESGIMAQELKENIFFANHNLINDYSFGEMNLIICRNVLIYFDTVLQEKVFHLFLESLAPRGFVWLGTKETVPKTATGID